MEVMENKDIITDIDQHQHGEINASTHIKWNTIQQ